MSTLQKLSFALVGTAVMLMGANPASAVSLVKGGSTSVLGQGEKTNVQGATTIDFNDGIVPTSGLVTFSGVTPGVANGTKITGSSIVKGSLSGVYGTPLADTSNYLAVSVGNDVTINFAQALDYFGFYWGSIDKYNSVKVYSKGKTNPIATFTGANVPGTTASGSQSSPVDNIYVNLLADTGETFDKIVLSTTSPAFETDNYSYRVAKVPEPSSILGLLAFGALSAGSLVKRKSKIA
ncbi:PEP-CTERM sorting domain-containing protein [Tolypothrix sp. PCC 7910]|uniref:Npun_F0296 family exosortase-dependent surface protein n=1 Tax=Tolypothrix sp. PCC 7910 TaxID=2099387 RepID=UPI0014278FAF|nr:PEP-CTERM sorting domain-containing protein [Tolypothrix sp. PCC 7910]QIR37384.1 PEP-CTERM sorting domain-containing protein [Tolypothrix sp. PCC 7910]